MRASTTNEIDEVVDEDQAAAIVDPGERQRQPARDETHQRPEICLHSGTVDERRAQNDDLDPAFPRRRLQSTLDRELAAAIRIAWARRVGRAERRSRPR